MRLIRDRLLCPENRFDCRDYNGPPNCPGVYAIFARKDDPSATTQLGVEAALDGLLYIGKAGMPRAESSASLRGRYHITAATSRSSSPRFSFGSLLFQHLLLEMRPNITGRDFEFSVESEKKLTDWLIDNCAYSYAEVAATDVRTEELRLLIDLMPPLNLNDVGKADRASVRAARQRCKDAARQAATETLAPRPGRADETVSLNLPLGMKARVTAAAKRQGLSLQDFVLDQLVQALSSDEDDQGD